MLASDGRDSLRILETSAVMRPKRRRAGDQLEADAGQTCDLRSPGRPRSAPSPRASKAGPDGHALERRDAFVCGA